MATSYLSPGVYVEEVDRGSKPIEAVGTNTVGFLGESAKGPLNESVLITNWSQFVKTFGDFKDCSEHLAHAVYGFFNNGGSRCFVVNVGAPEAAKVEAKPVVAGDKKDEKAPAPVHVGGGGRDGLYIGRDGGPGARTGLKCFEEVDEIAIVAAPGQVSPAVQDALLSHCETRKDRFAILDSPETITGGVDKLPKPRDSKYGAYYFPWIQVYDPDKGNIFVPPSGHIAGVYSRTDSERGVHKAPANEIVRGALGLKYNVSKGEQDLLNPKGINAIRFMNGGDPHLGRPHALERPVVALHQRSPPVHHGRVVDRARHPVGGVRAQRPSPLEARAAHDLVVPDAVVAQRRAHGHLARAGVLRQVRRGDQPARGHRRRPAGRRDRSRAGEARGIRHLPDRPDGVRRRRRRVESGSTPGPSGPGAHYRGEETDTTA